MIKRLLFIPLIFIATTAYAGSLLPYPLFCAVDGNGNPLRGGKLYSYEAGTSTAKDTYSDRAVTTANDNPLVLNSEGCAEVYLDGEYKLNLLTRNDRQVPGWPLDNVWGMNPRPDVGVSLDDVYDCDLGAAITAIGATETTLIVDCTSTLADDDDDVIPATTTLQYVRGGLIQGTAGGATETLTINGGLIADSSQQIFGSNLTVSGMSKVSFVYPDWWQENTTHGTTDMITAITAAVVVAKAADTILAFNTAQYLISSGITLSSASGAVNIVYGNHAEILKAFDGVGITITGGAYFNEIRDLTITGSGAGAAQGSASVSTSHGISINSRVRFYNVQSNSHQGHGISVLATANLNGSIYQPITTNSNDRDGQHFSGTQDNISVWRYHGIAYGNYEAGFFVETDVYLRQWDAFIFANNNAVDGTSSQVDIGKSNQSIFWIYAEETASTANEIVLQANTTKTAVYSIRGGEISDLGTYNKIEQGGSIQEGSGSTPLMYRALGTNVTVNSAKYLDYDYYGASNHILYNIRMKGTEIIEHSASPYETVAYTSGSEEPAVGDTLVGATSTETAVLVRLTLSSGSWAGGDAAGTLYIRNKSGAWQAENINISGGTSNVLTIGGDATHQEVQLILNGTGKNIRGYVQGVENIRVDASATAAKTRLWIWDVDNATLEQVAVGAADSGGAGYKVLRIPN